MTNTGNGVIKQRLKQTELRSLMKPVDRRYKLQGQIITMPNLLLYKSPQDVEIALKISRDVMFILFEIKGYLLNRLVPLQVLGIAFHC